MSGTIIYPSRIREKTGAMDRELQNLKDVAEASIRAMLRIEENRNYLQGKAWDSVRNYIQEVQKPLSDTYLLWIEEQMEGNRQYSSWTGILPLDPLEEDKLDHEIEEYHAKIEQEQSKKKPIQSRIDHYRNEIRRRQDWLKRMGEFISRTGSAYDRAEGTQAILERADTELAKVSYDPVSMQMDYTGVDRKWLREVTETSARRELLKKGISEREIIELEAEGFNMLEIKAAFDIIEKGKEEKVQISDLDIEAMNNLRKFAGIISKRETEGKKFLTFDISTVNESARRITVKIIKKEDGTYNWTYLKDLFNHKSDQLFGGEYTALSQVYNGIFSESKNNSENWTFFIDCGYRLNTLYADGEAYEVTAVFRKLRDQYHLKLIDTLNDVEPIESMICKKTSMETAIKIAINERSIDRAWTEIGMVNQEANFAQDIFGKMTDWYYSIWNHNTERLDHKKQNDIFSLSQFSEALTEDMYIKKQGELGKGIGYLFADTDVATMGCGPVAVYNSLRAAGSDISFNEVLYGTDIGTVGGGANILVMGEYMEDQGYKVTYLLGDEIDKKGKNYDAIIVTCTNTKFDGHYYTMVPTGTCNKDGENLYQFYNGYKDYEDCITTYEDGVIIPGKIRDLNIHVAIAINKK